MVRASAGFSDLTSTLASLAAKCLKVPMSDLSRRVPLTRYGLDSLVTVELTAAIEQALRRRVPESVLIDYPDLESLERYLMEPDEGGTSQKDIRERMRIDSMLPPEICPSGVAGEPDLCGTILLSGATGFLGGYLIRSLLQKTRSTICCIARSDAGESGAERIRKSMKRYGIWDSTFEPRLQIVEGDMALPRLGIGEELYAALCNDVNAVYHCAATVNWVHPYSALREVNVLGTCEVLRFACTLKPKPFHFVSSAAVCYSTWGPPVVHEDCDIHPFLHGLHLGYAQSKCVAESLVRQAAERGLPVTIHRPSLITGDRVTGVSNPDDLLSRVIKGMILMEAAPDLDWSVDCCPVDFVADAIVDIASRQVLSGVSHLVSPVPRHWRELVLWMNLFGYRVRLLPYRDWLERVREDATTNDHPLRGLLPFFSREPDGEGGLTLPELYEDSIRSRVSSDSTHMYLKKSDLGDPCVNANLLDRYFRQYIAEEFLPSTMFSELPKLTKGKRSLGSAFFTSLMRYYFKDSALKVAAVRTTQSKGMHSIISELSSWKHGSMAGLDRYQLQLVRADGISEAIDVVVKRKSRDEHLIDTAEQIAELCSENMGQAFARFGRDLGLVGSNKREIGIYRQKDKRFRRHAPVLYGARCNDRQEEWTLVLEDISKLELLDSVDNVAGWRSECIEAAIRGLAELHSIWYGRSDGLLAQSWLGPITPAHRKGEMNDLWTALADHAGNRFSQSIGASVRNLQRKLITEVRPRWHCLDSLPQTLIHNDFNPRNIALRREDSDFRLCAYDWELATVGVPQHDLAEFLCFVLKPGFDRTEVNHYLNIHRTALERASNCFIDPNSWETGFRLSLHDLLIDRFAMYAMIDRFRPQRFLPRVVSSWHALYELFPLGEAGTS